MIPRMDSENLNKILSQSREKLAEVERQASRVESRMKNKLDVTERQNEYNVYLLEQVKKSGHEYNEDLAVFYKDRPEGGLYDRYGMTICPRYNRHIDLFNIRAIVDEDDKSVEKNFFRDIANIGIQEEGSDQPVWLTKDVLMDDQAEDKGVFFQEVPQSFSLVIQALGDQCFAHEEFNTIALDPYLPGTFTLESIKIQEHSKDDETDLLDTPVKESVKSKIKLERNYRLYKLTMDFQVKTEDFLDSENGKQLFGLKKLGLYREEPADSYVVVKFEKDSFIRDVKEDLVIHDIYGTRESTVTAEKIQLFLGYDDGYLHNEIYPSGPHERRTLPVNSQTIYVRVPLKETDSLIGLELKGIYTR